MIQYPMAQQHPGMPHGQPMGPGQVHPGQMGQPMMHPGVAGPHGQQVTQAGPMGMGPGMVGPGGPSAHAMSHLAPTPAQMQQLQSQGFNQQQFMNNPQMLHQFQQQQAYRARQQQIQRLHAQQQQQAGMHMGPQHSGLSQQQMAAMQVGAPLNGVALPQHLQQQMAQTQMMQQQQHAAQQAHQQNLAHQQHMAMQHAHSQNSNQGHPTSQPGGPGPQGPVRPATAMGTSSIEAHSSPAPTSGPHPNQQQAAPQNQQSQQQQTSQAQAQASGPQMPAAQTQSAPQNQNPNQQSNPQQQQGQQPQQANQQRNMSQPQGNMSVAAMELLRRQQAQQSQMSFLKGSTMLKVFNFADKLGAFRADQQPNDMNHWRRLVEQNFTQDGVFRVMLRFSKDGSSKTYEVNAPALPRYFFLHYESEVDQIQLLLDGSIEKNISDTHQFVQSDRARMLYWFRDGTQLIWNGKFTALYAGEKIDTLTFETREHITYLPRSRLEEMCAQASPNQNKSPRMTKTTGKQNRHQQSRQQQEQDLDGNTFDLRKLPSVPLSEWGVTPRIQSYLELGETMSYMQDLMYYSKEHPELSVGSALNALVQSYNMNGNAQNFGQNAQMPNGVSGAFGAQFPQGARTPSNQIGMQRQDGQFMTMSPAIPTTLLPGAQNGSPHGGTPINMNSMNNAHTPSPHQVNMAPPMQPQGSQQGSNTGASANTSPNVSGKRRRSVAQGVKNEDNDGTNGVGPKVKASPRMNTNNKRLKNN